MILLVLLLEGNANMMGCGALSLPSRDDINSAPVTVTDRLTKITTVNLTKGEIGFDVEGQKSHKTSKFTWRSTGLAFILNSPTKPANPQP